MEKFRIPSNSERYAIVGSTGSGKTQFANHILSYLNWNKKPWIIFDYKHDDLIGDIPHSEVLGINEKMPKHAGIYIMRPTPRDDEIIEKRLWDIWSKENTGIYIDEGYMIPEKEGGLQACLTQGRSKKIPMIILSQRPAFISRFCFTEADILTAFRLSDIKDRKRVFELIPEKHKHEIKNDLPPYHSLYYDVKKDNFLKLSPAPDSDTILNVFESRKIKKRKFI